VQGYLGRVPEAIQEDLRLVGIRANLHPLSAMAMNDKVGARRHAQMGFWGWIVDYPDASSFFDPTLSGSKISEQQCMNYPFYSNREVDRLLALADVTFDAGARTKMLQQIEAIAMDDAPWVPVVHEQRAVVCSRRLHGLREHPVWVYRLEKLWVDP